MNMNLVANENYLTEYINHLVEQGKSINTIKSYSHDIGLFFEYFGIEPQIISRDQIAEYKEYLLKERNVDAKTINRRLSALKSYNEFLVKMGYQDSLVILGQDYIRIQKQLTSPTSITKSEAIKFMERIRKNECDRNYYIVALLLNTGLRISEALNIELDDINFKRKNLKVIGKGSKQRIIPLNETAIEIIKKAIDDRKNYKYAYNVLGSKYLFLSNKSEKLESSSVERIFNKHSNVITCHSLRHVFATNFLENGGNLKALQQILGHGSLSTTQIYLHPSQDDIRKSMNNCAI